MGLFGQRSNLVSPRFWRMLRDIVRFYAKRRGLIDRAGMRAADAGAISRRAMATRRRLIEDHLLPMGAAIWSTTPQQMRDYPLRSFLRFFSSHGLLRC